MGRDVGTTYSRKYRRYEEAGRGAGGVQVLGREVGTIYSKRELKHLISIHVASKEHQQESGLTHDDERIISGALDYKVASPSPGKTSA